MERPRFIRPKVAETEHNSSLSSFACICGAFLTFRQLQQVHDNEEGYYPRGDDRVYCLECGKGLQRLNALKKMVSRENANLLDASVAKAATWYHATEIRNWDDGLQKSPHGEPFAAPYIHVGTLEAALDIAWIREYYSEHHGLYDLYEITLSPETVVSKSICLDENSWPARVTEDSRKLMRGDALRYLNVWEAPGSISMIVDSSKLAIRSVRKITVEECSASYLITKAKQAEAVS